jgi:hypothetical protein
MWALIEDNEIKKIINNPKGLVIDNTQYSRNIFSFRWSEAERNAIGIYEVVFDNSNKKDQAYYNNTNQSFNFADGKVTASYGTATARELEDTVNEDDSITQGLKSQKKANIKQQASSLLAPTDWYVVKATDVESYSVPSAITTYRANVRTKSNDMEVLIDACSTVDELAALYQYVNTGTEEEPVMERPLGEFPEAV